MLQLKQRCALRGLPSRGGGEGPRHYDPLLSHPSHGGAARMWGVYSCVCESLCVLLRVCVCEWEADWIGFPFRLQFVVMLHFESDNERQWCICCGIFYLLFVPDITHSLISLRWRFLYLSGPYLSILDTLWPWLSIDSMPRQAVDSSSTIGCGCLQRYHLIHQYFKQHDKSCFSSFSSSHGVCVCAHVCACVCMCLSVCVY